MTAVNDSYTTEVSSKAKLMNATAYTTTTFSLEESLTANGFEPSLIFYNEITGAEGTLGSLIITIGNNSLMKNRIYDEQGLPDGYHFRLDYKGAN